MRSLTLPPALLNSHFAYIWQDMLRLWGIRCSLIKGVLPMFSRALDMAAGGARSGRGNDGDMLNVDTNSKLVEFS